MPRYFVKLAYDGTSFHGWQIQPNATTVQQEVQEALSVVLKTNSVVTGCGRTDTGVHAKEYFLHFDSVSSVDENKLITKLNGLLPSTIAIYRIYEVSSTAHTRFDAIVRSYTYRISQRKNPFETKYAYQFKLPLDVDAMNVAANKLLRVSDFSSFCKIGSDAKTTICNVSKAYWKQDNDLLLFEISADRFLRNMVRAIVGTLLDVGLKKITIEEFNAIIKTGNRAKAGTSAPARGLYLTEIKYPKNIMI